MSTVTTKEKKEKTVVQPFGIVADHPRNADLSLSAIPGCVLRSRIIAGRTVKDPITGEERIPTDQAVHLGKFPEIPGMQLFVNPAKLSYRVVDPLEDDEDLCERILRVLKTTSAFHPVGGKLKGVPEQNGTLDKHRMKCLVRELVWMLDAGDVQIVRGAKPEMGDVDALPGKYLTNPGSTVRWSQPTFEEDFEGWYERLVRSGA